MTTIEFTNPCSVDCCYGIDVGGFSESVKRVARKYHECCECQRMIRKGELYEYISGCWEGSWSHYKVCLQCSQIAEDFLGRCWVLGEMRSHIWECLGVDIVTGGVKE